MTKKEWFLLQNSRVNGPFTTNELIDAVNDRKSPETALVSHREQREWYRFNQWHPTYVGERVPVQLDWFIKYPTREWGPMDYERMIETLRKRLDIINLAQVRVSIGRDWLSPAYFANVVVDMGLRLPHPRVNIVGEVTFRQENGRPFMGRARNISQGGLGMFCKDQLPVGQTYTMTLRSPVLGAPHLIKAKVVYQNQNGETGLKFELLMNQTSAAINSFMARLETMSAGVVKP